MGVHGALKDKAIYKRCMWRVRSSCKEEVLIQRVKEWVEEKQFEKRYLAES